MENLLFSLHTVFPLLVMMLVGFLARCLHWIDDMGVRKANSCVFHVFLPLLLFFNILGASKEEAVDLKTLLFALIAILFIFGVMFLLAPKLAKNRRDRGVLIQGICRSNYAIYGIPLVLMMYPDRDVSIAAMMVTVAVPLFNVLSTVALMVYSNEKRPSALHILKGILCNPLIIGTVAGFLFWKLGLSLPTLIDKPLRQLSTIATPLALFMLGASLNFTKAKANLRLLCIGVTGKLIVVPLITLSAAIALGIRDVSLASLIALFATPVSVSSFPMAQLMGGNDDLAGEQVVFTTSLSIITIFLWTFVLRALGYLG
ncbi:MAG: AEC family transporter [Eubacteriales bacterium]|nr:AEC family transporter [Eubacteriales bacterium]